MRHDPADQTRPLRALVELVDQRRPQRVVVLPTVHDEDGWSCTQPPRHEITPARGYDRGLDRGEPIGDPRVAQSSRYGVRAKELLHGVIALAPRHSGAVWHR